MGARNRTCELLGILVACTVLAPLAHAVELNLGQVASPEEIAGWNIDVFPDGTNLPAGMGTVLHGKEVYMASCAGCHGASLEGGLGPALTGGKGSLTSQKPLKTVGSYWPYATTLFDYVRRAMPFQESQSLTSDELYAVSAYILNLNGIIGPNDVIDAHSLPKVRMPNRDGFIPFPRNPK